MYVTCARIYVSKYIYMYVCMWVLGIQVSAGNGGYSGVAVGVHCGAGQQRNLRLFHRVRYPNLLKYSILV